MKKLFAAGALLGLLVVSAPQASAVSYTLKELVEGNVTVDVGCLSFANFSLGQIGLQGDVGAVLTSLGYAADGSEITIDFVETANGVELRYSAFDVTVLGTGGPLSISGNVAFEYDVFAAPGTAILCAGESGAFGAKVAPPTNPVNIGTASFNVDMGANGTLSMVGAKDNQGLNIGFTPDEIEFDGVVTSLEVHKDLFVQLVLGQANIGEVYNIHVSDYIQEYCCDVPEPGTIAFILAGGTVGLLFRRRRK